MTLKIAGQTIPGTTLRFTYGGAAVPTRRMMYWDVIGEAEIVGKRGGREIQVDHVLHNGYSQYTDLRQALLELNNLIGSHGDLALRTTVYGQRFDNVQSHCTFDMYEPIPWPGQDEPQPLKDLAGTLYNENDDADEGWFQLVSMRFRQLRVD